MSERFGTPCTHSSWCSSFFIKGLSHTVWAELLRGRSVTLFAAKLTREGRETHHPPRRLHQLLPDWACIHQLVGETRPLLLPLLLLQYMGKARTRCHSSVLTSIFCCIHFWQSSPPPTPPPPPPSLPPQPPAATWLSINRRFALLDFLRKREAMVATFSSSSSWTAREANT